MKDILSLIIVNVNFRGSVFLSIIIEKASKPPKNVKYFTVLFNFNDFFRKTY